MLDDFAVAPADTDGDEVDLTNLIDPLVMLVALLMLIMPPLQQLRVRQDLQLTESGGGTSVQSLEKRQSLLEINASGELLLDSQPVSDEQFRQYIEELAKGTGIQLAGDRNASYGRGLQIRSLLQDHGIQVFELVRQPVQEN
jgi:biopolymer transport protein ExbD